MAALFLGAWGAAPAQQVFGGLGRLHEVGAREATYSWHIGYLQPLTESWAASFTWLNEGHLDGHHRDGSSVQVWGRHRMERNQLVLGAGLGPYRTFDTVPADSGQDYRNRHGVGALASLRAEYPLAGPHWLVYLQMNRAFGARSPQTQAALVGLALRLDHPGPAPAPARGPEEPASELAFLSGTTILNSYQSETSAPFTAFAVDYRHRLAPYLDLSATYCDEGGIHSAKRDGLAAQVWASARPGPWLLSAGVGPYLYRRFGGADNDPSDDGVEIRAGLRYSMAAGLHLSGHWGARVQWHRVLTRDHRDTDMLLAGLAYAW
jgi:hypothetical protein